MQISLYIFILFALSDCVETACHVCVIVYECETYLVFISNSLVRHTMRCSNAAAVILALKYGFMSGKDEFYHK